MTGSLVLQTLDHAWRTMSALDVRGAVMGGIALSAWQHVRATRDVDLLVGVDIVPVEEVLKHFQAAGFRPKRFPPIVSLGLFRVLQMTYASPGSYIDLQLDLLFADTNYNRVALDRRVPLEIDGVTSKLFLEYSSRFLV